MIDFKATLFYGYLRSSILPDRGTPHFVESDSSKTFHLVMPALSEARIVRHVPNRTDAETKVRKLLALIETGELP